MVVTSIVPTQVQVACIEMTLLAIVAVDSEEQI